MNRGNGPTVRIREKHRNAVRRPDSGDLTRGVLLEHDQTVGRRRKRLRSSRDLERNSQQSIAVHLRDRHGRTVTQSGESTQTPAPLVHHVGSRPDRTEVEIDGPPRLGSIASCRERVPETADALEQAARCHHETIGLDQAPGRMGVVSRRLDGNHLAYCSDWIKAFICGESAALGARAT